mgnify:CR=1 FL=1
MIKLPIIIISLFVLTACSNTPELETGEIKTLKILKEAFNQINSERSFLDVKDVLTREQIDTANIPVLFVELETGQNGTLTPYPGQGVGRTWLGADGATITFNQGVLVASRGMGDDVMGGTSSMPAWAKLKACRSTTLKSSSGRSAMTDLQPLNYLQNTKIANPAVPSTL